MSRPQVTTEPPSDVQFDFGQNWQDFSAGALTNERIAQARTQFETLIRPIELSGHRFLDIGFGQGLSLLIATALGARTVGCDINPKCAQVLSANAKRFPELAVAPPAVVGSILDEGTVTSLRTRAVEIGGTEGYDIVHSWGVLHHTGDMARAIRNAARLVAPGGHLVLAIYNRHWSSRPWLWIKHLYVHSPRLLQRALIALLYPVIYLAKWLVTWKNPKHQERGMDFYYNVVDWVGGYPYEYASVEELVKLVAPLGFTLLRVLPAQVPTGCNEFVFRRT